MAWAVTIKAYISEEDYENETIAESVLMDGLDEVTSNYNIGFCIYNDIHKIKDN